MRINYQIVFMVFICVAAAASGCSGMFTPVDRDRPVEVEKPVEQKPVEAEKPAENPEPAEKPEPAESEQVAQEEKPAEKTPEELGAEARQLAVEELATAIERAKTLAVEEKFNEALILLDDMIERHKDKSLDFTQARAAVEDIITAQVEAGLRKLQEDAKAWFNKAVAECNRLVENKEYAQALEKLEQLPAKYKATRYRAMVDDKVAEVQAQHEEWKALQEMLREAEDKYGEIITRVGNLLGEKKFREALDLIDSYQEEYSDAGKEGKLEEIRLSIDEEKTRYEELQYLKTQAQAAYEEIVARADALVEQGKYSGAIELLEGFPAEYAQFGYGEKLGRQIEEIYKNLDILEDKIKAAQARQDKEAARAKEQVHGDTFENVAIIVAGIILAGFVIYLLRKKKH